ncbi:MAG: YceI family protein [bacterium]|jgi:rhodanese-related sulfurtransferase|nr:YceI family protein [bacterium]
MAEQTDFVTASDLAAALSRGDQVKIVDVLPAEHHAACRLDGAMNACVYEVAFAARVSELVGDRDADVVVYGAGGGSGEAQAAIAKLRRLGYRHVRELEGGLQAWHAAGLPVAGQTAVLPQSVTPPQLVDGAWVVDPARSRLHWTGRNANGGHDGTLDFTGGAVSITAGVAQGRIALDPGSLRNLDLDGNPAQAALVAHLLSDDFLFAESHPDIAFTLASAVPIPGATITTPTHRLEGTLELRGIRAPLAFEASITVPAGAHGDLVVSAVLDLDRTLWGIGYGSARFFAHLGMHAVFDRVGLSLRVHLVAED